MLQTFSPKMDTSVSPIPHTCLEPRHSPVKWWDQIPLPLNLGERGTCLQPLQQKSFCGPQRLGHKRQRISWNPCSWSWQVSSLLHWSCHVNEEAWPGPCGKTTERVPRHHPPCPCNCLSATSRETWSQNHSSEPLLNCWSMSMKCRWWNTTKPSWGASPAVLQSSLHPSTAGGINSIPGQGIKIPHASWCSQTKTKNQLEENRSLCYLLLEHHKWGLRLRPGELRRTRV